jgi:CheY-like chemotaxis protein
MLGEGVMAHTVLIVDDSKLARMVATKALAKLRPDWACVEAGDAKQAVDALQTQDVDISLIDLNMPGEGGLALAADLRRQRPNMPIAVVTANVQDEIVARVRELDATFVPKPLTEEALSAFLTGAKLRLGKAAKRGG